MAQIRSALICIVGR